MYPGSKAVKITAKTALKGKYLNVIFTSAIFLFSYFIVNILVSLISIIEKNFLPLILMGLFLVFILAPLFMGLLRYVWRLLFNVADNPISIFYYFSEKSLYKKVLKLIFLILIRAAFFAFLLLIPAFFFTIISSNAFFTLFDIAMPLWAGNLQNILYFLYGLAFIILPFTILKYYIAPVLFVADDNIDPAEAIHMSTIIYRKFAGDYIILNFSFLGWFLLSIAVFPLLVILPYYLTSYAVHTRFIMADYNKNIEKPISNFEVSF